MQTSQPWDGIAEGDASRARYDADEWAEMYQDMFNSDVNRGVLRSRGSELVGSIPGVNQFRIASGAALVKGRWYNSNTNVNFAPASATGGNWRRDRIVLSSTWADIASAAREPVNQTAQTIRLIRLINPVPAENGPARAVTQNAGVLWEIPLYRIQIEDDGTISNSWDDREFLLAAAGAAGMYDAYVCVRDVKPQNTHGGQFTQGAWQTRDINNEQADANGICTIAVNQITLAAGTYRCIISAPAQFVDAHQTRLYNVSDATTILIGTVERVTTGVANYTMTRSFIVGRFTLAAEKTLEVQHRCQTTRAVSGFGERGNFTDEIYTVAEFWRES